MRGSAKRIYHHDFTGGADEIRTHDLCSAIAALSHLSYSPVRSAVYVFARATVNEAERRARAAMILPEGSVILM